MVGPGADQRPGPPARFVPTNDFPASDGPLRGRGCVASGSVFVIATHREPLPVTLGRPQPGGRSEARERALVRAAQEGSSAAVEELFRRHWPSAHRAAFLIVQDASTRRGRGHRAGGVRRGAPRARPFRSATAVRAVAPPDRREPRDRLVAGSTARREVYAKATPTAEGGPTPILPRRSLLAALSGLAPEQRAVVVLRHLLGYTPGQVARSARAAAGTVNSRLRRALDRLADELGERP